MFYNKITLMFTNTNSEYTMSKTSCILNVPVLHRCKPACVNNWLDNVNRLSRISGKDHLDVTISTSIGQLHKYISELMGSGLNWDMIKTMIQERFLNVVVP